MIAVATGTADQDDPLLQVVSWNFSTNSGSAYSAAAIDHKSVATASGDDDDDDDDEILLMCERSFLAVIGGEQQQQRAEILLRRERKFTRSRAATARPRTEGPARDGRSNAVSIVHTTEDRKPPFDCLIAAV
ncbi:unnamed protein product [Sphagnum jensenii]|uniref:Uncharacterized protein n=1 Tax=Sphagnum jensenii TaxID=128206 RepID=A0ABP1AI92_9BRYO